MENLIRQGEPVFWRNEQADGKGTSAFTREDVDDAAARLERFAPFIVRAFPETACSGGIIESPLTELPRMRTAMGEISHRLFLKRDDSLPISGSIKARGGIYEVLKHAETLAVSEGLLRYEDDYGIFAEPRFREFFGSYKIAVGSTGNLGLSIGIISAALGFSVSVYMSKDARQWKKDLLRSKGVNVVESDRDYEAAVAEGRAVSDADPKSYFIDDENSADLFLGYAVAGRRLKKQLKEAGIIVDALHPLCVYLPCGVGGGPGGAAYGLSQEYGADVHCYFAEPTQAPAVLLGLMTGKGSEVSASEYGLDGKTAADGLAVKRPSGLVCREMSRLLKGCFTVEDETLFRYLKMLYESEGIEIEPSACAGFDGVERCGEDAKNVTHIVWATGGSMVPPDERLKYRSVL